MFRSIIAAGLAACFTLPAYAQSGQRPRTVLDIGSYTCEQFLDDAGHPNEPQKLIRALMLVSWAAGYAAKGEHSGPRADVPTLELVSASLKLMCQLKPDEFAIKVFVAKTSKYLGKR
jgi:hypothetical protein